MPLLSGFIGAILGVIVTQFFNIWKFHRDERSSRLDELCRALLEAATLAAEYWATEFRDEPQQRVQEARILGAQALIDGIYADLRGVLRQEDSEKIDNSLSELFEIMSGGDFSVKNRAKDPARIASPIQAASAAVVEIRRSHRKSIPLWSLFNAYHENRRRQLDMPPGFPGQDSDCFKSPPSNNN